MVVGAGTSPELTVLDLESDGSGAQVNVSLNNSCNLSSSQHCGDRCLLNQAYPAVPEMSPALRRIAITEILDSGRAVRHMSIVEKEPFASPELLRDVLSLYHERSRGARSQSVGCITNGVLLKQHFGWLRNTPLSWCLVSLDGMARSHLRGPELWRSTFENLLELRRRQCASVIGVNTVVTSANVDSVIGLGELLSREEVDHWGLGVYMRPDSNRRIVSSLTPSSTKRIVLQIAERLANSGVQIVFELDPQVFTLLSGLDPYGVRDGPWRLEHAAVATRAAKHAGDHTRDAELERESCIIRHSDRPTTGRGVPEHRKTRDR